MLAVLVASWPLLVALVGLLVVSAFFSGAETAIFTVGPADMRGASAARKELLRRLLDRRGRLLVTILLGNLVVNILYFNLGSLLAFRFDAEGVTPAAAATPVILLLGVVLFAEILPKSFAVARALPFSVVAARPLFLLGRLLFLPRVILSGIALALGRLLLGAKPEEGTVTSEELEELLELAAREGQIAPDESERLQSLLLLSRIAVREIMVPRTSIAAFRLVEGKERFLERLGGHRRNKVIVYRESLDEIDGFLDAKEVLTHPERPLTEMIRPVAFVPEVACVADVMEQFLEKSARIMVVVDEYGGTEGVLTFEDLVQAVIGDLADESDRHAPVEFLGPGHYRVDAGLRLRSWRRIGGRHPEDLPVVTVGGMVTALLGRLPRKDDEVSEGSTHFKVVSMRGRRPGLIEVKLGPRPEVDA